MWTYPVVIQMLEDKFFFFCFDYSAACIKSNIMCMTLMIESKNLLKNLASKFTQKLAQDIASKTRKEK